MASTGSISIAGVVSGFDTDSIITKLTNLQQKQLDELDAQKADLTTKKTSMLDLNTRLLALQTSAKKLGSKTLYQTRTATASDTTVFRATATTGNDVGTFNLSVEQTATQHQLISQGYGAGSDPVGKGTVTLQVGSTTFAPITINEDNNTLEGLRDAINSAGYGVRASILDDGSGATPKRLVLTSDTFGADGKITATFNLSGGTAPTTSDLQAAQNAKIKLGTGANAVAIESSSNTLTNVVPGVTINLLKADPGVSKTLTLTNDTGSVRTAVEGMISSYNQLNDYLRAQFQYDPEAETVGALFGNSSAQRVQGQIQSALLRSTYVQGADYSSLNAIGIKIDKTGALSIADEAKFSAALAKPEELQKLFGGTDGVATRLQGVLDKATNAVSGSITSASNAFQKQIDALAESRVSLEERLQAQKDALTEQFSAMESALASMKSQSSIIAAQLGSASLLDSGSSSKSG